MTLDLNKIRVTEQPRIKITQVINTIKVGKPGKTTFFRTRTGDDWTLPDINTYSPDNGNKDSNPYLVIDEECKSYLEDLKVLVPVQFYLYQMLGSGILKLDMVSQRRDKFGNQNDYHRTRMEAYELAKTRWVRMYAANEGGFYIYAFTEDNIPDPVWSSKPANLLEALDIAFKGYIIDSMDHPEIKKLRGKL